LNSILVVDDQIAFANQIQRILQNEGYRVEVAVSGFQALELMESDNFDLYLVDMKMPGMDGIEFFKGVKAHDSDASVIFMTAFGSIESAVEAMKMGASHYLQKPFPPEELMISIQKVFRDRELVREVRNLRRVVEEKFSFGNIISRNHKMREILDLIFIVAQTDSSVMITGETGVGKELVAKSIHYNSRRKKGPFVSINCGALTETLLESELFGHEKGAFTGAIRQKIGKFEYASGGSLFLDEIGDISSGMQMKILRVLQEKSIERVGGNKTIPVDVRIISATNKDLQEEISRKNFRLDLYYRLNVVPIRVPPLRERREDVPLLVEHFLKRLRKETGREVSISLRGLEILINYPWPGNVRELENVIERAFILERSHMIDDFPPLREFSAKGSPHVNFEIQVRLPFKMARTQMLREYEKAYLIQSLRENRGNLTRTSKSSGIALRTLWRKMKEYEIRKEDFKKVE
jgi:DNA-binding NtrC family response regulator